MPIFDCPDADGPSIRRAIDAHLLKNRGVKPGDLDRVRAKWISRNGLRPPRAP